MSIHLLTTLPTQHSPEMPVVAEPDTAWIITPEKQRAFKPHKHLPRNRNFEIVAADLRALYNYPEPVSSIERKATKRKYIISNIRDTSELPPTPPAASLENGELSHDESSIAETTILRSGIVTPTHKQSPPTPDNTPPRKGARRSEQPPLEPKASVASTRAESYTTAREEFASEEEFDFVTARSQSSRNSVNRRQAIPEKRLLRPSPLADGPVNEDTWSTQHIGTEDTDLEQEPLTNGVTNHHIDETSPELEHGSEEAPTEGNKFYSTPEPANHETLEGENVSLDQNPPSSPPLRSSRTRALPRDHERPLGRGLSLRERLVANTNQITSPSTEDFGDAIGWSTTTNPEIEFNPRSSHFSGGSSSSPSGPFIVNSTPVRQQTLRHRNKQLSLRAASSPIPAHKRDSLLSNPASPQRSLTHKKAKLTNQNRLSFSSEISQSLSTSSSAATASKPEVIHVAVIPERRSSLQSSANSSKRHSAAFSAHSENRRLSNDSGGRTDHLRPTAEMYPYGVNSPNRGRDRRYPPQVPARGSSLSAPTSRSNSRSNSLTSDHIRGQRIAAEKDLRKTLDRMESDRIVLTLNDLSTPESVPQPQMAQEVNHEQWTGLKPRLDTPYSQSSIPSASPDPVEISQATAINMFAHTNKSLQLIESNSIPETKVVRTLKITGHGRPRTAESEDIGPSTPRSYTVVSSIESPLRNPRRPPNPPNVKVVAAPPAIRGGDYRNTSQPVRNHGSLKRPSIRDRRYSESYIRSVSRSLSLNTAQNRKVDQELDSNLYPMWRPKAFWDDFEPSESDDQSVLQDGIVLDSAGMPRRRKTINGPISLIRSISNSSRRLPQNQPGRGVMKRRNSSQLSLAAIQAGQSKNMRTVGSVRRSLHIRGLRDVQDLLRMVKMKKEDEKRERRRELLRQSIGPDVISQSDSRFPRDIADGMKDDVGMRLMTTVSEDNLVD